MTEEILILHGWQNRRPDGHWQRWLAAELASRGSTVHYPQLPEPDAPVLDDWIDAVESQLRDTDAASLTVVAHSLGCLLWLAYVAVEGGGHLTVDDGYGPFPLVLELATRSTQQTGDSDR